MSRVNLKLENSQMHKSSILFNFVNCVAISHYKCCLYRDNIYNILGRRLALWKTFYRNTSAFTMRKLTLTCLYNNDLCYFFELVSRRQSRLDLIKAMSWTIFEGGAGQKQRKESCKASQIKIKKILGRPEVRK